MQAVAQATKAAEALDPGHLLDSVISKLNLKNDAALAKVLDVAPPVISKIRHHALPVGATILISMHEETGWSIEQLRGLMNDRRKKFRGQFGAKVMGE